MDIGAARSRRFLLAVSALAIAVVVPILVANEWPGSPSRGEATAVQVENTPPSTAGSPTVATAFVAHLAMRLAADARAGVHIALSRPVVGHTDLELAVVGGDGRILAVRQVRAWLALPEKDIPPLPIRLAQTGPGTWADPTLPLPYAGRWILTVTVSAGDEHTASIAVPVGG